MSLQSEFETMAAAIVANGRKRYDYFTIPSLKVETIQEMGKELRALKEAYAIVFDSMSLNVPSLQ